MTLFVSRFNWLGFIGKQKPVWLLKVSFLVFVLCLACQVQLVAQERTITGQVVNSADGTTLPGVSIRIKGTSLGTTTDIQGSYQIKARPDQVLVFSFVGYKTQEIQVGNQSVIQVRLAEEISDLEEVVVIGYGSQKKKMVTGATSHVTGEDLEIRKSTSVLQALQGKAAGINITSTSGQPGEPMKVVIRGLGTTGSSAPLYIVDGVQTGDIDYLNSADIESIDFLKDAASAAIYGSRAANGVVLINTKKGQQGRAQVSFDAYFGVQNVAKKVDMLDAREYAIIMNEQHLNSGGSTSNLPFDVNNLPAYTTAGAASTDWLDQMFVRNALTQNYNLSTSGGNDQTVYSMSISYTGQEGLVGGKDVSNFERYGGRFNSESNFYRNRIRIGQHINFMYVNRDGIGVGGQYNNSLRGAFNTSPLLPVYDDNGEFFNAASKEILDQNGKPYWNNTESSPYAGMIYSNQDKNNEQKIVGDVFAEIEPVKNLKFRSTLGIDYYTSESRSFTPIYQLSVYSFATYTKASQNMSKGLALNLDNLVSYTYSTGLHTLEGMLGMSARKYNGSWMYSQNSELAFEDLDHAWLDNATNQEWAKLSIQGGPNEEDRLLSYFGRAQYNYNETWLLNATLRADGSSKFAKGNRWGYFPSVSAGWVMTNADFMSRLGWIDFLKVRASWGQNGNQAISAFQYLAPIKFTQATYAFGDVEGISLNFSLPVFAQSLDDNIPCGKDHIQVGQFPFLCGGRCGPECGDACLVPVGNGSEIILPLIPAVAATLPVLIRRDPAVMLDGDPDAFFKNHRVSQVPAECRCMAANDSPLVEKYRSEIGSVDPALEPPGRQEIVLGAGTPDGSLFFAVDIYLFVSFAKPGRTARSDSHHGPYVMSFSLGFKDHVITTCAGRIFLTVTCIEIGSFPGQVILLDPINIVI